MINTRVNPVTTTRSGRFQTILQNVLTKYHWFIAFLLYSLIGLILTSPIIFHFNDAMIGAPVSSDAGYFVWQSWWFKQALETGHDPAYSNSIFALLPPVQIFTQGLFYLVVSWPLQLVFNPLATFNLILEFSFGLSGMMMYLLASEFTANKRACFLAGFIYTFSTYHFARISAGHFGMVQMEWLPFFAWRTFVFYRKPNPKNALLLGIGLALVPASDPYYLPYFALPFAVLFAVGKLITDFKWFRNRHNLLMGALAILIGIIALYPTLYPFLKVDPEVAAAAKFDAKYSTEQLSANLAAYFLPQANNPFFGQLTNPIYQTFEYPWEKSVFLGYVGLALTLVAFGFRHNRNRATLFWLLLGLIGIIFSIGPKLYITGEPIAWWPIYNLVFDLPLLSTFRAPVRLGILPLMAVSLLAAYGINSLSTRFETKWVSKFGFNIFIVVLLSLSFAEQLSTAFPYPIYQVTIPALYNQIGTDQRDVLLLDLPVALSASDQYYQITHRKRLAAGDVSRLSYSMQNSLENIPYLNPLIFTNLIGASEAEQGEIYPLTTSLKAALQEKQIGYVVLHQRPKINESQYQWMFKYLIEKLGQPFYNSATEKLSAWRIDPGTVQKSDGYQFKLGTGWLHEVGVREGKLERVVEQDGRLLLNVPQASEQTITFKATPYFKPLTLEVRLNGVLIQTKHFEQPSITQEVRLENLKLKSSANSIELHAVEGCSIRHDYEPQIIDVRCFSFGIQDVQIQG